MFTLCCIKSGKQNDFRILFNSGMRAKIHPDIQFKFTKVAKLLQLVCSYGPSTTSTCVVSPILFIDINQYTNIDCS